MRRSEGLWKIFTIDWLDWLSPNHQKVLARKSRTGTKSLETIQISTASEECLASVRSLKGGSDHLSGRLWKARYHQHKARVRLVVVSLNLFQGRDRTQPSDALGKGRAKQPEHLALKLNQSIVLDNVINIYLLRLQFWPWEAIWGQFYLILLFCSLL